MLSRFADAALTRSEMKSVKGGQCYYRDGNHVHTCNGLQDCKQAMADGWGQNYCCDNCGTASWCKGGKCGG